MCLSVTVTALHDRALGFLQKNALKVRPSNVCQHTKCYGPVLTGASFASTSEVLTSTVLELLKLLD
jgi:hypothetical protein